MGQQYRSNSVNDNPNNAEGAITPAQAGVHGGINKFFPFTDSPPNPDVERWIDISDQIVEDDGVAERDVITPNHALPMPLA